MITDPIRGLPKIGEPKWIDDRNQQTFNYRRTLLDWTPSVITDYSTAVVSWYDASWANTVLFTNAPGILANNTVYRWMSRGPNANDYLYSYAAGDFIANTSGAANNFYAVYDITTESMPSIFVSGFKQSNNTPMVQKTGTGFSVMPSLDHTIVVQSAMNYGAGVAFTDGNNTRIPVHCGFGNANTASANTFQFGRYVSSVIGFSTTYTSNTLNHCSCVYKSTNSSGHGITAAVVNTNAQWLSNTTVATTLYSANSTFNYFSVNGVNTGFASSSTTNIANSGPLWLGASMDLGAAGSRECPGWFQEVIIFNRLLTLTELAKVEGYLAWKWGTETYLPNTHPYFSVKPKIDGAT